MHPITLIRRARDSRSLDPERIRTAISILDLRKKHAPRDFRPYMELELLYHRLGHEALMLREREGREKLEKGQDQRPAPGGQSASP
jgi:hypothetical protein